MMYVAKRADGTFETLVNGLPYHVTDEDPLFEELSEQYADLEPGKADVDGEIMEDNRNCFGWVNGESYNTTDFGPLPDGWSDTPPPEVKAAQIRAERDALLAATDYLMLPDYPISDADRQAVSDYRQALRDITLQEGFPDVVVWPEKPVVAASESAQ